MTVCNDCPRKCGAVRNDNSGNGFCASGLYATVSRAAPHMWEEPCISGTNGSGTVFFGGCNLRCAFCQNSEISRGGGVSVSSERLRDIFLRLAGTGVHNLNLVTPTHYHSAIRQALGDGVGIPVVWNSGGYDGTEIIDKMNGCVDIYMPDFKYALKKPAADYSCAPDYPERALETIRAMYAQVGDYEADDKGILKKGVLIRHLVLPGNLDNTFEVIDRVAAEFGTGKVLFSLMGQYTPPKTPCSFPELNRKLTEDEYNTALDYLFESGIEDGYTQDLDSAEAGFVPPFDLTGV